MTVGVSALGRTQIGIEAVAGSSTDAPTTIWTGTGIGKDMLKVTFPKQKVGVFGGTSRSYIAETGGEVLLEGFGVEGGGHHDELEIGAEFFLEGDSACEGDIAVEVSFVEFVEHDAADAFEEGVGEHHPEEDTFGDEPDAGAF